MEAVLTRRSFVLYAAAPMAALFRRAARAAPPMRVTRIDTVYWKSPDAAPFWPHWTWVRLHTDNGLTGIGETYPRNSVEAEMVHSYVAPLLLKRDPRDIDRIWAELYRTFDYQVTGGTEMRVLSAIDLALWDLLGKSLGTPVYRLIGGKSNPTVRLYNTCFPYKYDFNKSESNNKLDKCLRRAYSKVDDQVHARAVCFGSGKAMAEGVPHLE